MNILPLLVSASFLMLACGVTAAEPSAEKPVVAVKPAAKLALKPGDAVDLADLTAAEWLKGEAPKSFEPGKIYIFECWATWCGACVAIMPHLEEMHKKFHDKGVYFYGMDVWEKDRALGEKFVREKGGVMPYPVAYVGKDSPFEKKWLKAAGVRGIPTAFVVKDGKLLVACFSGRLKEETLAALLNPESCDKTVAGMISEEEVENRCLNAYITFLNAEKKGDFAVMEKALADAERAEPRHPVIGMIKSRLAAAREKDTKGKAESAAKTSAKLSLKPGDTVDLADLTATEWLKGEAPKSFEPGKIYVFECWATWCGACVAIMPHLEEMHQKFHDKGVYFHGMDVWEDDKALGEKFVREKGGVMPYPVAYVGKNSPFEKKWLKAAGVTGIPHAFVVKDGKLLVACGPGRLTEETLTAMLSPESCDKVVADIIRKEEIQERAFAAFLAFRAAEKKGDFAAMEKALADGERDAPGHPTVNQIKRLLAAARAKAETAEPVAKTPVKPTTNP